MMTTLNDGGDAVRHARRDTEEIGGDQNRGWLTPALERQRLCMQGQRDALRRLRASGEPCHPERTIRSDVDGGDPGAPSFRSAHGLTQRHPDRGNRTEKVTAFHGLRVTTRGTHQHEPLDLLLYN